MGKTKAPSGLKIARDDYKFVFSWKLGEKYSKQDLEYKVNNGKWVGIDINAGTKSKAKVFNENSYYPIAKKKIKTLSFRVRGKADGKYSAWTEKKVKYTAPKIPSLSVSPDDDLSNVCTFTWSLSTKDSDKKPFTDILWQTMLVGDDDADVKDGKDLKWSASADGYATGTSTRASYTRTITEDTATISNGSHVRWFRVCARGVAGQSEWRYAKRVYSKPLQAQTVEAEVTETEAGGLEGYATWSADSPNSHPIDKTIIQYTIAVPSYGMTCPDGASWTDADTSRDTGGSDSASFSIDGVIGVNQCLFVRVNTYHEGRTTYGTPVLAKGGVGVLANPSGLSVNVGSTNIVRVNATNEADEVEDSFLVVQYRDSSMTEDIDIGIIPHGEDHVEIQCPDWGDVTPAFKVYAVVGEATPVVRQDGITVYNIVPLMTSATVIAQGGQVPMPPSNVKLYSTETVGTIRVTWDWAWDEADTTILSWSDHADAWESTDEPSEYRVSNLHASQWNISGLETGITWYVRLRFVKTGTDTETLSPWSEMKYIPLTSAPAIPRLVLSSDIIPMGEDVTASWNYSTTDGTGQLHADIADILDPTSSSEYVLTSDTEVLGNKAYLRLVGDKYITVNTSDQYVLTADTSVISAKTYYEPLDDIFVEVENPSGNPSEQGLYELNTNRLANPTTEGWYQANYKIIKQLDTERHVVISPTAQEWSAGETHYLAVRVDSASGQSSGWSTPVAIVIADPIHVTIGQNTLMVQNIPSTDEDGNTVYRNSVNVLEGFPFLIDITGAGDNGTTTVVIERRSPYYVARPDESDFNGYQGETVYTYTQIGENTVNISADDISLDDDAEYTLTATVRDGIGQTDSAEIDFEVHWNHQAIVPEADVEMEGYATLITPKLPAELPENWELDEGDRCDIYRLSADKPELIVQGAEFGTTYVDPYPAIGDFGGHRVVFVSSNGDFYTADNEPAWIDLRESQGDYLDTDGNSIVDFDGRQLLLYYSVDVTNTWEKDYRETRYMGGSIQGDWNAGVKRSGSVSVATINLTDRDKIADLKALADYVGQCHIRTLDGSSYPCDIQVSENRPADKYNAVATFALTVSMCEAEELDGMTYEMWSR